MGNTRLVVQHAFDTKSDGTTTLINMRWPVDELMYNILILEGYVLYGRCLQYFDMCVIGNLDNAWDNVNDNTFCDGSIGYGYVHISFNYI